MGLYSRPGGIALIGRGRPNKPAPGLPTSCRPSLPDTRVRLSMLVKEASKQAEHSCLNTIEWCPMNRRYGFRFSTTWMLILVVWMAAFMPFTTQALAPPADNANWVEVCGVGGSRWVQGETPATDDQTSVMHPWQSCPFCLPGMLQIGLPPVSAIVPPEPVVERYVSIRSATMPPAKAGAALSQPRAPPLC